jgi:hypothetical protein
VTKPISRGTAVVVRVEQHRRLFTRIARVQTTAPLVVKLRVGTFGGTVRWSRFPRELSEADLLREATPREVATGYLVTR